LSRRKIIYCDVCRCKCKFIDDRDFAEGKRYTFTYKPHVCEPPEAEPRADIELTVSAQRKKEGLGGPYTSSVDLCLKCMEDMLREVLSE